MQPPKPRIALGMGNNVDYEIVWDSAAIEALVRRHGVCAADLREERPIAGERDLLISILRFVQAGIGGERTVLASPVLEAFARHFETGVTLGGTPVRAAIAMRTLGHTAALHLVTLNDHVRRLLPEGCQFVCSSESETLYPHLIVQFGPGARVRANDIDLCAPRPNRIIYHHDTDNICMALNPAFGDLVAEAQVMLIGGFNAMQSEPLLRDRLATLGRIMDRLPSGARVFYEDAGFYNPALAHVILDILGPRMDIYSLNEDELQAHLGRSINLLDAAQVRDALADLQRQIPAPMLVVHSMYWALTWGQGAPALAPALKGGVTMATTRYCHGDGFAAGDYHHTAALPPNEASAAFAAAIQALAPDCVACVPVAQVEVACPTTIGLGDAFVGGFLPALLP